MSGLLWLTSKIIGPFAIFLPFLRRPHYLISRSFAFRVIKKHLKYLLFFYYRAKSTHPDLSHEDLYKIVLQTHHKEYTEDEIDGILTTAELEMGENQQLKFQAVAYTVVLEDLNHLHLIPWVFPNRPADLNYLSQRLYMTVCSIIPDNI